MHNDGGKGLWHLPRDCDTQRHDRSQRLSWNTSDYSVHRMGGYKSPGLPFFRIPPPSKTPTSALILLLHCDFIILRIQILETLLWEAWGQTSKETWSDCESVGRVGSQGDHLSVAGAVSVKQFQSQLWWCKCDCQSGSWTVTQESFLSPSTKHT